MLFKRIITALFLLIILLSSLYSDNPIYFVSISTFAISMVLFEWLNITILNINKIYLFIFVSIFFLFLFNLFIFIDINLLLSFYDIFIYYFLCINVFTWFSFVLISVILARKFSVFERVFWSIFSIFACVNFWIAIVIIYISYSSWFLISLLVPLWVLDTSGYFIGKAIGKRKLAYKVSPGKTLEGALSGILLSVLCFIGTSFLPNSYANLIFCKHHLFISLIFFFILSSTAILGDLFESLLKRNAGIKDSGNLLPGHGGFFDRLDAVIPFVPMALIFSGVLN